jgi:hypothetical protein
METHELLSSLYECDCLSRRLKFGRLIEGPLKPKGKIRNPENFAPGGWKMQCLTYMGEHITVITLNKNFIKGVPRALNTILKPVLQKRK